LAEHADRRAEVPAGDDEFGAPARSAAPAPTLADLKFPPAALLELVQLVENKTISTSAAQQAFAEMFETGASPAAIVQAKGLAQVSDEGAIEKLCDEAIAANPKSVADYQAGKVAALNALKGQVMKLSKGKANPALAGEILERKLKA
jgi:aspartyl-tRNA(Asn)/glutamyl-tRNA(Gln) amidotransferase subunit B